MNTKNEILASLREELDRWEDLLGSLSEEQIVAPRLPGAWSIKDIVAHLWGWQQRSIARVEAALADREPVFPKWPAGLDPSADEDVDKINAWIYDTHREQSWPSVHRAWREGFLRFVELAEAVPERDLLAAGRYPWLEGRPLSDFLVGSYEHHHIEHLEPLIDWLRRHGDNAPA